MIECDILIGAAESYADPVLLGYDTHLQKQLLNLFLALLGRLNSGLHVDNQTLPLNMIVMSLLMKTNHFITVI